MAGQIHIGTSGWHYADWRDKFYPARLSRSRWLEHYASRLPAIEINSSFYRLPGIDTLRNWHDATPDDFHFAIKAPRSITHLHKLRNTDGPLFDFLARLDKLHGKLGPILFQLPPHWHVNTTRLAEFLGILPGDRRYAVEIRDPSWYQPAVLKVLREHGVALCIHDLRACPAPLETTAEFVYLRLHGPGHAPYTGSYPGSTLNTWLGHIKRWSMREGRDVYLFFNNDQSAFAPRNAVRLLNLLREQG